MHLYVCVYRTPCYSKMQHSARRAIQCSCFTFNVNIRYNCVFSVNSCLHLCELCERGDRWWWWLQWKKHECVLHFMLPTFVYVWVRLIEKSVSCHSFIHASTEMYTHTHTHIRPHGPQLDLTPASWLHFMHRLHAVKIENAIHCLPKTIFDRKSKLKFERCHFGLVIAISQSVSQSMSQFVGSIMPLYLLLVWDHPQSTNYPFCLINPFVWIQIDIIEHDWGVEQFLSNAFDFDGLAFENHQAILIMLKWNLNFFISSEHGRLKSTCCTGTTVQCFATWIFVYWWQRNDIWPCPFVHPMCNLWN